MHPHPPWAFMACNGDTFIFKIIHEINFKIRSIRKQSTLNAIYPPWAEPEARNSAVGWHWNTHTFCIDGPAILKEIKMDNSLPIRKESCHYFSSQDCPSWFFLSTFSLPSPKVLPHSNTRVLERHASPNSFASL